MRKRGIPSDSPKRNQRIRLAVSACLVLVILISSGVLIARQIRRQRSETEYERLAEALTETDQEENPEEKPKEEPKESKQEQEPKELHEDVPKVDFEKLWEQNEDVCAWISIPGTGIDYPVLRNGSSQDPYDAYYLDHTIDKSQGLPGAIYMEPCNSGEFTDFNTLIYGHNMRSGAMFGDLHKYEDADFLEENDEIYVVTPEETLIYQIFGVVEYDDRHIMAGFDFDLDSQRQEFLDSLKGNEGAIDILREDTKVSTDSRIITLSTCVSGADSKRLLVTAVLAENMAAD